MFVTHKTTTRPTLGLLALGISVIVHLALLLAVTGVEMPLPNNSTLPVLGGEGCVDIQVESVRLGPGF